MLGVAKELRRNRAAIVAGDGDIESLPERTVNV
jgi:hypothetical protein